MARVGSRLALLACVLLVCACGGAAPPPDPYAGFGSTPAAESSGMFVEGEPEPGFAPAPAGPIGAAVTGTDVWTDPGELPSLKVAVDGGEAPMPLQHTGVKATLSGFTADVEVAQTYTNPYAKVIEASYVFPLPENAAVYSMKIVVGDRVIEAVVQERAAARRTYESARRSGHTAALLEQERPNVFTQSVANIAPGKKIDVVIRYVQDLSYDAGEYEFVFPMVVGPRYIPDSVPDAARISPPVLGKGERSGHDISLELTASATGVVSSFATPTHEVKSEPRADGTFHLQLSERDKIPNRDFVLRYRVAGEKPAATLYKAGRNEGFFSLVVQPPALDVGALVGKRELVFVVDVSGSMSGRPLAMCKDAMRTALSRMRPVDTFNVITFAGATGKLFDRPRPANDVAIRRAVQFVQELSAGGGTQMLDAIPAALSPDVEKGRHRYVFFMTDGFVGNEDQILASTARFVSEIESHGQRAKVFGFGIGSSSNRALLDGLGKQGKGLTVYATNREDPARAVNRFYRYIDRTVLRDVKIDFGALGATDVFPAELPDLFASHPMIVHGRYKGSPAGPVVVHAKGPDGPVDIPVTIAAAPTDDGWPIQGLLWARSKIGWLEQDLWTGAGQTQAAITALGIDNHLVTRFTSFVAVDTATRVGDGNPLHVDQPVEVPEGVDAEKAGAGQKATSSAPSGDIAEKGLGYDVDEIPEEAQMAPPSFPSMSMAAAQRDERNVVMARNHLDMQVVSGRVSPSQRGCACDVAGGPSTESRAWAALALAALAGVTRRRLVHRKAKTIHR